MAHQAGEESAIDLVRRGAREISLHLGVPVDAGPVLLTDQPAEVVEAQVGGDRSHGRDAGVGAHQSLVFA